MKIEKSKLEKFQEYDNVNPKIYILFKEYAVFLIQKGFTRIGSKLIIEKIRCEMAFFSGEVFKINNNYTAYYSRKFVRENPQYFKYFEFKSISD